MNLWSVRKDEELPGILIVTAEDGMEIRYRMGGNGVLYPGRVWTCFNRELGQRATIFIPLPDGCPELLAVSPCSQVGDPG